MFFQLRFPLAAGEMTGWGQAGAQRITRGHQ